MKKLLLLIVISLPFTCLGQNWRSVRIDDTTYYTIPLANDYLRVIWVDSTSVVGSDTIFHFYPSTRQGNTTTNCLDTLGPTWLGKQYIEQANGNELFFNRWLDTIILKPRAVLSSIWVLYTDTVNNEFRASITKLDTMTIDNQLDSIKEVTIQVFNNNVLLATHPYHNRKLILSKAHGFIECLEWYGFPTYSSSYIDLYRNFSQTHNRLNDYGILKSGSTRVDLFWKYQPGNIWQLERKKVRFINPSVYENVLTITEDSVSSAQVQGPDSLLVSIKRKEVEKFVKQGHIDSFTYHDTSLTFNLGNSSASHSPILPEFNNNQYTMAYNSPIQYYGKMECQRPKVLTEINGCEGYQIGPCPQNTGSVSTCAIQYNEYWYGFGATESFYIFPGAVGGALPPYDYHLNYSKIGNCEKGNKHLLWPVSVTRATQMTQTDVYPNPASQKIFIDSDKLKNVTLYTLLGKQLISCQKCNSLNIGDVENGIYILSLNTNKGVIKKKVVVQH